MGEHAISAQEIANREHISPAKTGDNISAKKVGSYGNGVGNAWGRIPLPLIDQPYDYVGFSNPDANNNYQTIVFNSGGSGGTTVRTLTLAFDANNKVTNITRS